MGNSNFYAKTQKQENKIVPGFPFFMDLEDPNMFPWGMTPISGVGMLFQ